MKRKIPAFADQDPNPYLVVGGSFLDQPTPNQSQPPCSASIINDGGEVERIGAILDDDLYYSIYPDESRERDLEYAYIHLKYDTALREGDQDFIDWYNSHTNSNYERFDEVSQLMEEGELQDALNLLNTIAPENVVQTNMKFVLRIAIEMEMDTEYVIDVQDMDGLQTLAWTPVWQGGNAVFLARAILQEEVNDYANGLRTMPGHHQKPTSNATGISCLVVPNPAQDYLWIKTSGIKEYEIKITDLAGKPVLVFSSTETLTELDIKGLKAGLYFVEISNNGRIISTTKVSKL